MRKTATLIFAIFILLSADLFAQTVNRSRFITDSLDAYVNRELTNWRVPGAAICIVKDNKVVLMKGYGVKELGLNNKVDENTLFMIGGNTASFTATALATLEEQKQLSLDDKVTKYISSFKLENKFAGEQATVRDLLCNRLGFETSQGDFTYWTSDISRDNVIEKMGLIKTLHPFRDSWGYCNAAYTTAGQIITKVTYRSWEAYLRDYVLAPLGMGNTKALSKDMPSVYNKAAAHTMADGRLVSITYPLVDNLAPAMSISSSVNDMSKWVLCLLNDGKVGPRQIIPLKAIKATQRALSIVGEDHHPDGTTTDLLYGLGFALETYHDHRVVMQNGRVNGFASSVTMVPDEHLGIIILTNSDSNELPEALKWDIIDAYTRRPFRDQCEKYLTEYKNHLLDEQLKDKKIRDSVAYHPLSGPPLNAYLGKYVNSLYGYMTISFGGETGAELQMRFEHHPTMFAHMQPMGNNRFYITFSDPEFGKEVSAFTVNQGAVTGVRVKIADTIERTPYDFKKIQ